MQERGGHDMRDYHANLRQDDVMCKSLVFGLAVVSVWLLGGLLVSAQETHDKAQAELAKALPSAKVSLAKGLTASARKGTPISGKFELEKGKLQLSVYTMKGDTFSEVVVNHNTGKVAKAEPITKADDLKDAKAQSEAMAKAKRSLDAAAVEAVRENKGFRAVSVMPTVKDGH